MPDKAVISHRGEKYEIGRGKRFYGIWAVGSPYEAPVDRWPENHDGWQQAWARFASVEAPGTITPVTRPRKSVTGGLRQARAPRLRSGGGTGLLVGEGLLVLGVVLGLAGLFPDYDGSQSLLSQSDEVVPHLLYIIGWALTAGLVALSVARQSNAARGGALFGLGLSAVTFGLFLADLGEVVAGAALGTGLIVSLLSWLACTVGSVLAFLAHTGTSAQRQQPSRPARPGPGRAGPLALLVLAGIGTAAAFAPSWDSYTLRASVEGTTQTITAGNAFDNPGLVIAGNVAVMVALVAVAVIAALWRPARQGALLLAGAIVPLVAEAVSALIQAGTAASPSLFGISSAQASAAGLTISTGLTAIFWVFVLFVISLIVSCAWLFTEPGHPVMPSFPASPWLPAGGEQAGADDSAALVVEDTESDETSDESEDAEDAEDADSYADSGYSTESPVADNERRTDGGEQSAYA